MNSSDKMRPTNRAIVKRELDWKAPLRPIVRAAFSAYRRLKPEIQPDNSALNYALAEIAELKRLLRLLLAESPRYAEEISQTAASFDTQWHKLPAGQNLVGDPTFDRESIHQLTAYCALPISWFAGKQVLDAGCGNGRWSYTLCRLGAKVTAVDVSEHGLENVRKLCHEFPGFAAAEHNLLKPLPFGDFDLVWNFGVCHHTGNTRRALENVAGAVRPGGHLFTMIYGEPRTSPEYDEVTNYIVLRRAMAAMTFDDRIDYLRSLYGDRNINGWFDATSPLVNDLHSFEEIASWLRPLGFENIRRTVEGRNHMVRADRV